ncbi:MAG: lysophospholipid acyltransferase family protein, partial [Desulfobacterales bacterium]|nr:lysophospholipid acyltransferase family protein [Desulfobacterales bacterium]
MHPKIKQLTLSSTFLTVVYRMIRLYSGTFRLTVENEQPWMDYLNQGGKVLLCVWHQQFFSAIHYFRNYKAYCPPLMISKSTDGDLIAGVAMRSGWDPVRGSSSKEGGEALRIMIEKLTQNGLGAHIVDGPRGPAGKVKAGLIRLAQQTNAVIVPFYTSADQAWYANSWDRFMIPKPFSKVLLRFGDMIHLGEIQNSSDFEAQRL